jgi:hypothetical protein
VVSHLSALFYQSVTPTVAEYKILASSNCKDILNPIQKYSRTPYMGKQSTVLVKFQVLMAMSMKMASFWDVVPCSMVDTDQHFQVS